MYFVQSLGPGMKVVLKRRNDLRNLAISSTKKKRENRKNPDQLVAQFVLFAWLLSPPSGLNRPWSPLSAVLWNVEKVPSQQIAPPGSISDMHLLTRLGTQQQSVMLLVVTSI